MNDGSLTKRAKIAAAPMALAPALGSAAAAAVTAAFTGEPALLQNIISFIPSSSEDQETDTSRTSRPALVLQTILVLCRAIPGLSGLVGPTNEAFWREMVLTHFDFATSGRRFNVEDWGGDWYNEVHGVDDECDDPEYASWHRHPRNGPHREWIQDHTVEIDSCSKDDDEDENSESDDERYTHPSFFLVDGLACWPTLQTYFKPAAYGFLQKIQRDRSQMEALWPDHEDAFSLYCDLLVLARFQTTKEIRWETWSDGEQLVHPCLMGRFPTKIVGRGFAMLKFCDFAPYFWTEEGNKARSQANSLQNKSDEKMNGRERVEQEEEDDDEEEDNNDDDDDDEEEDEDDEYEYANHGECEERTKEERSIFPGSQSHDAHPFLHLRRFVYETFSDWRRVHISQSEMASPEFYIGSTKRSGRWMGFVGQSDYWA